MKDKTVFEQYYEIRRQIDSLSLLESKLKEDVLKELEKSKEPTIKTEFGKFTKRITKKYNFSLDLVSMEAEVSKQIKEFSKPFEEKILQYSEPLKKQIENAKQKEIETGKAFEQVTSTVAFSYLDK